MKFSAEILDHSKQTLAIACADTLQGLSEEIGVELQGIYEFDLQACELLTIQVRLPCACGAPGYRKFENSWICKGAVDKGVHDEPCG